MIRLDLSVAAGLSDSSVPRPKSVIGVGGIGVAVCTGRTRAAPRTRAPSGSRHGLDGGEKFRRTASASSSAPAKSSAQDQTRRERRTACPDPARSALRAHSTQRSGWPVVTEPPPSNASNVVRTSSKRPLSMACLASLGYSGRSPRSVRSHSTRPPSRRAVPSRRCSIGPRGLDELLGPCERLRTARTQKPSERRVDRDGGRGVEVVMVGGPPECGAQVGQLDGEPVVSFALARTVPQRQYIGFARPRSSGRVRCGPHRPRP